MDQSAGKRFASNDDERYEAFVRLLVEHEPRVRSFLRGLLPTWYEVEEVAQEASLVAWRKFDDFEEGTSFGGWLLTMTSLPGTLLLSIWCCVIPATELMGMAAAFCGRVRTGSGCRERSCFARPTRESESTQLSCAWSSFFQPLAPSEHFSVAETTAVSYIICYSHTTSRPGPSDTIQAQPTAHSDRSKRPEDAEKRLHF